MRRNTPFAMLRSPRKDRSGYESLFENEELDEVEMAPQRSVDFLEREVQPGDSLQSIALEFNVSVADLKRVNNIHKENEIFARKLIRIPHKPYSFLLESKFFRSEGENLPGPSSAPSKAREETAAIVELVNNTTISDSSPLSLTTSPSSPPEDDDDETDVLLHASHPSTPDTSPLRCNFADGDVSWGVLLLLVIFIGIGGPLLYIWYFWGYLEKGGKNNIHHLVKDKNS